MRNPKLKNQRSETQAVGAFELPIPDFQPLWRTRTSYAILVPPDAQGWTPVEPNSQSDDFE